MTLSGKRLQVWHSPQLPCQPFKVDVKDEYEALKMINTLADQHIWLFKNKIIPDYVNSFVVVMHDRNEWVPYYNTEEDMEWDAFEITYENELTF